MDSFTWIPRGTTKPTSTALNTRVEFVNGNEQIQANAVNPKKTWEYTYEGTVDTINAIQDFFDTHAPGGVQFYFTDHRGVQHVVTFASDTCTPELEWGFSDDGRYSPQGGKVTLQFRKVWQ